jgi:CRP/FNR family cyclic AMP-dependent transcriptional regulator
MSDRASSTKELRELLAAHPFAAGMTSAQVVQLAGCCIGTVQFEPDDTILRAGDQADRCFLILTGEVATEVRWPGGGTIIQTIEGGEVLGWSWMFPPYRWVFDGRALVTTTALVIDGISLRGLTERDHDLGFQVMSRVARLVVERLRATQLQLVDLYGNRS